MTPGTIIASGYYLTAREQVSLAKRIDAEIAPLVEALEDAQDQINSYRAAIGLEPEPQS